MNKYSKRLLEKTIGIVIIVFCSFIYADEITSTDHYDGKIFHNLNNVKSHSFGDMIKWMKNIETVDWPNWIDDPTQPDPENRVMNDKLKVTYINHATVLIQTGGINIITDPIFSKRAGPVSWIGTKRIRNPGVKLEKLPKIDIILISHDHYDHLDISSLRFITKRDNPLVLTGLKVGNILKSKKMNNFKELDWWDYHKFENIKFTFVPAQHQSGRSVFDENKTLWGGFVIETSGGNIYFAGDSGYGDFFHQIVEKYKTFRLTILPIGSYEARWIMKTMHMNPEDAVQIHKLLNSKQSIGMHYGTFAEHPEQTVDQHEKDLKKALDKYNLKQNMFLVLKFGEGRYF